MAFQILTRNNVNPLRFISKRNPNFPNTRTLNSFSKISNPQFSASSISPPNSQYRNSILLTNLLHRYGFPQSQIHDFLTKNRFLLKFNSLEIEKSLGILISFKFPQKFLVSIISRCPGVLELGFIKKWELGLSKFGFFNLSSLSIQNVLQLSRRFQIDPDGFSKRVLVLKGLGFSDGCLNRVLEEFPDVIIIKEQDICERIEFLVGIGIPFRVFSSFPKMLGFGVADRLKPLLGEFADLGFSENIIRKEIVREPRVLCMELGEISRCLELLRSLKCRVPIMEEIFRDGAFRAGFEVKLRVDCLCKHGLIRRDAFKVLWKEPRCITYELEDIEKKIEFLVHKMKFDVSCLIGVPEYLGVNFEKQILPRHNVIEYLSSKGGLGCEVRLRDMIKPSRLRFYNLYVKPYPECEKLFGRFSGDVAVRKKHPIGLWKLLKPPEHNDTKEDVKNMKAFMETLV